MIVKVKRLVPTNHRLSHIYQVFSLRNISLYNNILQLSLTVLFTYIYTYILFDKEQSDDDLLTKAYCKIGLLMFNGFYQGLLDMFGKDAVLIALLKTSADAKQNLTITRNLGRQHRMQPIYATSCEQLYCAQCLMKCHQRLQA